MMRVVPRIVVGVLLLTGLGYFGYMGMEGSHRLVNLHHPNTDCRTPSALGLAYEAINYDIASDSELAAREANASACSAPGTPLGNELVSGDGVRLAGWYVPAASEIGPEGPTVVLNHGWNDSKSGMLEYVRFFHDRFNLVLFDYRNHNQSADSQTTQGINEQQDLVAVLDWLVTTKRPDRVILWGQSMGGHAAVNVAADDTRVDALILDSIHARVQTPMANRIRNAGYPLGEVGYLAVVLGARIRTGVDVLADDPITAIDDLGSRPLLLLHGCRDDTIPISEVGALRDAALAAAVDTRVEVCAEAGHGTLNEVCPADYQRWIDEFADEVLSRQAAAAASSAFRRGVCIGARGEPDRRAEDHLDVARSARSLSAWLASRRQGR